MAIATRFRAAIRRLSPAGSEYIGRADALGGTVTPSYAVRYLGGILQALEADVAAGYTQAVEELVHADVPTTFWR